MNKFKKYLVQKLLYLKIIYSLLNKIIMSQNESFSIKDNKGNIENNQTVDEFNITKNNDATNNLPFDISKDLKQYSKIFVRLQFNPFRTACCFERFEEYEIFGELPDGDKKLLFTCKVHFECCNCCDSCSIDCCLCGYNCCDRIVFQMEYKRNNNNFYTQGINLPKGCYCCHLAGYCCPCFCCSCCGKSTLYLRENVDPDNADINCGISKGRTTGAGRCCCFKDRSVTYYSQEGNKGPNFKLRCCEGCINCWVCDCCLFSCCNNDIKMVIKDGNDKQIGNILVPNGLDSEKVKKSFYCARKYYEINITQNIESIEKFKIITDVIHFDLENKIGFNYMANICYICCCF